MHYKYVYKSTKYKILVINTEWQKLLTNYDNINQSITIKLNNYSYSDLTNFTHKLLNNFNKLNIFIKK